MKKCRVCCEEKIITSFPKNNTYSDGYASICKVCSSRQVKELRDSFPHKYKATKFNTTPEHMAELLTIQYCEICGDPPPKHRKYLAVDHCHTTGKIRGMLCDACNTALGKFKDDIALMEKAIDYLKQRG